MLLAAYANFRHHVYQLYIAIDLSLMAVALSQ